MSLELHLDSVFRFGIGRYFPGILPTHTIGKLGQGVLVSYIWREPCFPPPRLGFCPLFLVKKKFMPNLQKGVPAKFHKMELPPNLTVHKIPTEYTDRLVPVTYQYQPNCQYRWDATLDVTCAISPFSAFFLSPKF
jgi:hypothetical protein